MNKDYSKQYNDLTRSMEELGTRIPNTMQGFEKLHIASMEDDTLPSKTKELIALGISIAIRCTGCITYHVKHALQSGASAKEVMETIGVAVCMGGGPAVVYGCEAMEALNQFVVLEQ